MSRRLPHAATAPTAFAALVAACAGAFLLAAGRLPVWALAPVLVALAVSAAGLALVVAASEHAEPVWWASFEAQFRAYAADFGSPA